MKDCSEGGEAGQYSPQPWRILRANADCTLYSASLYVLYTVFHSVNYNSVVCNHCLTLKQRGIVLVLSLL